MNQRNEFQQNLDAPTNLAELFIMFAIGDNGKLRVSDSAVKIGLAGAVLADLARRGEIKVTRDVLIPTPTGNRVEPPLRQVMYIIDQAPENQDAEQWVNRFARPALFEAVIDRLEARKLLEHEKTRRLGFFKIDRYRKHDAYSEIDQASALRAVLYEQEPLDMTTWPLLHLLHVTQILPLVFRNFKSETIVGILFDRDHIGETAVTKSLAEALQATENSLAEGLVATRGGPSGMPQA